MSATARLQAPRVVKVYGVSIESEWELDTAHPSSDAVQIRMRSVSPAAIPHNDIAPSFRPYDASPLFYTPQPDGRAVVGWDDLFSFVISADGSTILGHAHTTLAPDALRAHLFGPVLSFALLRCGYEPLHATAVTLGSDALALLGDSGAGKSTLAAALLAAGARLLTDDLLVVKYDDGGPRAEPGLPRIKLMPDTIKRWPQVGAGAPFHPGSAKRVFPLQDDACAQASAPLRACFVVQPGAPELACTRLTGSAAMQELAANTFNTLDVRPERLRTHFEACARLARCVPVFQLQVPTDLQRLEETVQLVCATLETTPRSSRACRVK